MKVWRWLVDEIVHAFVRYRGPTRVIVALIALIFIFDFAFRVYVGRNPTLRVFTPPQIPAVAEPENRESMASRVRAWFPPPAEIEVKKERVMALEGVFGSRDGRRAVLSLATEDGSSVERVGTTVGQVVDGWTVTGIDAVRVTLRRDDETRELLLFRRASE